MHFDKWCNIVEVPIFEPPKTQHASHFAFSLPSFIPIFVKWSQTLEVVPLGLLLSLPKFVPSLSISYIIGAKESFKLSLTC